MLGINLISFADLKKIKLLMTKDGNGSTSARSHPSNI